MGKRVRRRSKCTRFPATKFTPQRLRHTIRRRPWPFCRGEASRSSRRSGDDVLLAAAARFGGESWAAGRRGEAGQKQSQAGQGRTGQSSIGGEQGIAADQSDLDLRKELIVSTWRSFEATRRMAEGSRGRAKPRQRGREKRMQAKQVGSSSDARGGSQATCCESYLLGTR